MRDEERGANRVYHHIVYCRSVKVEENGSCVNREVEDNVEWSIRKDVGEKKSRRERKID